MKYYSIHEFSKLIGRTPQTIRNWDSNGNLKPDHTGASGYRYYSHEQLREVLQIKDDSKDKIVTVFSCRLQGKRANKARKMIQELVEENEVLLNDSSKES